jgi:thiol-disulfide isomerase/thioredoxin
MNKKYILPSLLIIVLLLAFYMYSKYHVPPSINFNSLSLVDLQNQPVKFESFKGKKMVVGFSASWCPNCLEELADLQSVKESLLPDVEIVVISDEPIETIQHFKDKKGYTAFTFLKMNSSFSSIGINSIPTSYIVNRNLQVTNETVGYVDWKDPSTCEHLKKLME